MVLQPHLVILLFLSLVVAALGVFLMVLPQSRPAAGVLDAGWRPAEGGEHAADLVGRGHGLGVAVCESGAGACRDLVPGRGQPPGDQNDAKGVWFEFPFEA